MVSYIFFCYEKWNYVRCTKRSGSESDFKNFSRIKPVAGVARKESKLWNGNEVQIENRTYYGQMDRQMDGWTDTRWPT